jgi:signal transduction histidine kinase/CheY-like chemotaxis protein
VPADATFSGRADFIARFPYHPEDRDRVLAAIKAHYAGRSTRMEIDMRILRQGETRWMHATLLCSRDASGALLRASTAFTDITERTQLERQLGQAQRLEAMGTLAGGIAHDFNNILGAILGFGEMAQRGAALGTRLRRDLDSIMTAGERGRALVDRILAFSRSGVGERVPVHVERVVREALDHFSAKLAAGIQLEVRLSAGHAAMMGDPTQVHQVLMNLASNAMQAMPGGGTLRVSLNCERVDSARAASIGTVNPAEFVILQVADSGSGIPPDILDRIFDPFFTTKEVGVGTGLGLSLVHGIVTDLGGGIDVVSTRDAGSTFTVWMPQAGRVAAVVHTEARVPRGDGQRILLVDDEVSLVHLGEEMLAALGYEAAGYTSSVEALAAFAAEPQRFDAVLSDETMPQLAGSQMALQIRKIRPDIPIVLMSGYVGPNMAAMARQANVNELLPKPLVSRDIAKALARVFAK